MGDITKKGLDTSDVFNDLINMITVAFTTIIQGLTTQLNQLLNNSQSRPSPAVNSLNEQLAQWIKASNALSISVAEETIQEAIAVQFRLTVRRYTT